MGKTKKNILKKILIIGGVAVVAIAVAVAIAVVPTALINSRFGNIFNKIEDMSEPSIVITDMGTESNLSGEVGEMLFTGAAADFMLDQLVDVADDFEYVGREDAAGSFDLRYRVSDENTECEFYLSETGIYYIRNGKKYVFEPEDQETNVEYKQIYNAACLFVK